MKLHGKPLPKDVAISYAQNREDVIIQALLYDISKGFYVDVGANDPVTDSVTRWFYEKGWHGINIEPNPTHAKALKRQRPRDVTVQALVANAQKTVEFREYTHGRHGLSTAHTDMKEAYEREGLPHKDYKVQTQPLRDILASHLPNGQSIDFLKVDVEGYEYEVLESNDWQTYRPKLIIVEANHIIKDWHTILEGAGYKKVFFDGLNEYFASPEYSPHINYDNYVKVATEGKPVTSWQAWQRSQQQTEKLEAELQQLRDQNHDLESKLKVLQDAERRLEQHVVWTETHPTRFFLSRFYHYYVKRDRSKGVTR